MAIRDINSALLSNVNSSPYIWAQLEKITICLARLIPSVDDLDCFFYEALHKKQNDEKVFHNNVTYLTFLRERACNLMDGRFHNLLVLGLSCNFMRRLSRMDNDQITELALYWPGHVYRLLAPCHDPGFGAHLGGLVPAAILLAAEGDFFASCRDSQGSMHGCSDTVCRLHGLIPTSNDNSIATSAKITECACKLAGHKLRHKIIGSLTNLSQHEITKIYKNVHPDSPSVCGHICTRKPEYFVWPHKRSAKYRQTLTLFAAVVRHLQVATRGHSPHIAWFLLESYQIYEKLCWPILMGTGDSEAEKSKLEKIDINEAHMLCRYILAGDLRLVHCKVCGSVHLESVELEHNLRHCPVCAEKIRNEQIQTNLLKISKARMQTYQDRVDKQSQKNLPGRSILVEATT